MHTRELIKNDEPPPLLARRINRVRVDADPHLTRLPLPPSRATPRHPLPACPLLRVLATGRAGACWTAPRWHAARVPVPVAQPRPGFLAMAKVCLGM